MKDAPRPPHRPAPALGAQDGVRQDYLRNKEAAKEGNPNAHGVAWTHNFLNQKPWHPMNFRNRTKVWEAEQQKLEQESRDARAKERGFVAEFQAEQEKFQSMAMLSSKEQEMYRQRQSVSFLYMKPPGYEATLEKDRAQQTQGSAGAGPSAASGSTAGGAKLAGMGQRRPQGDYVARVVEGFRAANHGLRMELREGSLHAVGTLPSDPDRPILVGSSSDEEPAAAPPSPRPSKRALRHAAEKVRVAEAKAFLREAGVTVPEDDEPHREDGRRRRRKRERREKKDKRQKKQKKDKK